MKWGDARATGGKGRRERGGGGDHHGGPWRGGLRHATAVERASLAYTPTQVGYDAWTTAERKRTLHHLLLFLIRLTAPLSPPPPFASPIIPHLVPMTFLLQLVVFGTAGKPIPMRMMRMIRHTRVGGMTAAGEGGGR